MGRRMELEDRREKNTVFNMGREQQNTDWQQ